MDDAVMRFTLERRERFLALLTTGQTAEQAAAAAGISPQSVRRWASRGRAPGASVEHREFARRYDELQSAAKAERREGTAEEAAAEEQPLPAWQKVLRGDPLVSMELDARPGCYPELSEAQQRVAHAVADAHFEAQAARLPPEKREQAVRRALLAACKAEKIAVPEDLR